MEEFQIASSGRRGSITYSEGEKRLNINWEMSGGSAADILLAPLDLRRWSAPAGEELPVGKPKEILHRLRDWLAANKIRSDIDLPRFEFSTERCAVFGCQEKAIQGFAYCVGHYDANLLGLL